MIKHLWLKLITCTLKEINHRYCKSHSGENLFSVPSCYLLITPVPAIKMCPHPKVMDSKLTRKHQSGTPVSSGTTPLNGLCKTSWLDILVYDKLLPVVANLPPPPLPQTPSHILLNIWFSSISQPVTVSHTATYKITASHQQQYIERSTSSAKRKSFFSTPPCIKTNPSCFMECRGELITMGFEFT